MAEEDFTSIPRITPDRDDIGIHRGRKSTGQKPEVGHPSHNGALSSVRWGLAGLAILFVITVSGCVYFYKQLVLTRQALKDAVSRIEQLETRLVSTDTTITKSEVLLAAKLKTMDDLSSTNRAEIKKLWGGFDRNSRAIDAGAIELKSHQAALESMKPQLQQATQQIMDDSERLKTVEGLAKESGQRIEVFQENVGDLTDAQTKLKEKQSAMETDLVRRITSLEDAVKSTDVFRRNTQDELRRLKDELVRLQSENPKTPP